MIADIRYSDSLFLDEPDMILNVYYYHELVQINCYQLLRTCTNPTIQTEITGSMETNYHNHFLNMKHT